MCYLRFIQELFSAEFCLDGRFSWNLVDACPLHSRVERAVHADLAGGTCGRKRKHLHERATPTKAKLQEEFLSHLGKFRP